MRCFAILSTSAQFVSAIGLDAASGGLFLVARILTAALNVRGHHSCAPGMPDSLPTVCTLSHSSLPQVLRLDNSSTACFADAAV